MMLRRLLNAIVALVLFVFGWLGCAAAVRTAGGLSGLLGTVYSVALLTLSAIAAHRTRLRILEAILGTLILVAAVGLLLFHLTEMRYDSGLPFHTASLAAVLAGAGAYALYRRRYP